MARYGLTQLPRKVAEHTGLPAPTYRKCFDGAVGARFPAEFAGNRWTWDESDLDAIARGLGMMPAASDGAGRKDNLPASATRATVERAP